MKKYNQWPSLDFSHQFHTAYARRTYVGKMECSTRLAMQPVRTIWRMPVDIKASVRLIDVSAEWQAPLGEKSLPGEQDHVGIVHVQQQRLQPQASGRTSKLRPEVGSSSEQAASCPPPPCACHGTRWPCSPLFMRRKLQLLQARG